MASVDQTAKLRGSIQQSGYYPDMVEAGLRDVVAEERVVSYVVHHEPTFDRDEIRRHLTVLVLTPTRLILTHTDEHPPDDLLPEPYTSTTTEDVSLSAVNSVVVTRMITTADSNGKVAGEVVPREVVISISWGTVNRIELEPARCADPQCEADHGLSGSVTGDDFTLRVSSTADGEDEIERVLDFGRRVSAARVAPA